MDASRKLLEALRENARTESENLARQLGMSQEEVEDGIATLEDEGIVRGYQAIVDWERTDQERAQAAVELNVTLDRETGYEEIAMRIARFPQVTDLRLVSGDFDFLMQVEADTVREISRFVSEKVAPVPEVTQTVTHFVMDTYKERGIELRDGHDDDRLSVSP
ncbi:Lrp/AsnC family transcriptional regulator [Natronorarus salvus]|uniref:Lrp/AsnC family transcriptional regulator n=1 Tax=Natronorarus salvus TaxID=3117733 RepID=UPI002F26CB1F